jgi:hypothetical protein
MTGTADGDGVYGGEWAQDRGQQWWGEGEDEGEGEDTSPPEAWSLVRVLALVWWAFYAIDDAIKKVVFVCAPLVYLLRSTRLMRWVRSRVFVVFDMLNGALGIGGTDAIVVGVGEGNTTRVGSGRRGGAQARSSAVQARAGLAVPRASPRTPRATRIALEETEFVKRGGTMPPRPPPAIDLGPDGPNSLRVWPRSDRHRCYCGASLHTFLSRVHECQECAFQGSRQRFCSAPACGAARAHSGSCHPRSGCLCARHRTDVDCHGCGRVGLSLQHTHRCTHVSGTLVRRRCGRVFCAGAGGAAATSPGTGIQGANRQCGHVVAHADSGRWWQCVDCKCAEHAGPLQ